MADRLVRRLAVMPLALALVACGTGLIPGDAAIPPGGRQWIISVENSSAQPARLMVAEDTSPVGELVGTAQPATVPAKTTQDVVFTVPPGTTWAIFVNPSPDRGPLILAQDVPLDVSGRLPITITIGPNGEPGAAVPAGLGPGWFGE